IVREGVLGLVGHVVVLVRNAPDVVVQAHVEGGEVRVEAGAGGQRRDAKERAPHRGAGGPIRASSATLASRAQIVAGESEINFSRVAGASLARPKDACRRPNWA